MVSEAWTRDGMNDTDHSFWREQAILITAVVLAILLYIPDGMLLWDNWVELEEFNHGPLMLVVALYLLWKRKDMLLTGAPSRSWLGLGVMVFAAVLYLVSIRAAVIPPRHYSILILIYGLFLFAGGKRYGNCVMPSLVLMLFAVPPPAFVNADLTWALQIFSTDLSVQLLRLAGVSVFQDGNVIDLGKMKLEVAEACAGLRYLYPMVGLGALSGMLFDISWAKRGLFLIIAAVVAILMNSVRIFFTGLLVDTMDISVSEGFFHLFEGWVYFIVSFAIMLGLCRLILKKAEWDSLGDGLFVVTEDDVQTQEPTGNYRPVSVLAAIVIFLPLIFFVRSGDAEIPDRQTFSSFPLDIGGRIGREQTLSAVELKVLQMTDYFLGRYRDPDPNILPVSLFIGYFESQKAGQAPHSPRVCIPAGGWVITDIETIELALDTRTISLNRAIIERGEIKQLVYYWYQQRGKIIANGYEAKIDLLLGGITSSRTDGALVRLVVPIYGETTVDVADKILTDFAGDLIKILPAYVPG